MNENRTRSILQRLPLILAVTAASYGLPQLPAAARGSSSTGQGTTTQQVAALPSPPAHVTH